MAELPLTVQLVSVVVPSRLNRPPPCRCRAGGVAADGAVGQRGRAAEVVQPPPPLPVLAELPLTVQLVSVAVPPSLYRPPPLSPALPPVIVSPEIDAVTPPSTWNTRLSPPPLTVTPAFGPVIVSVPVVSLSSSWPPVRVIVCGVLNTVLSKVIVSAPPVVFAWAIAWRRSIWPVTGVSVGLLTTIVDSSLRSSSARTPAASASARSPARRPIPARLFADPSLRCDSSFCRSSR